MTQSSQTVSPEPEPEHDFDRAADERTVRLMSLAFEQALERDRRHHRHSSAPTKAIDLSKLLPFLSLIAGAFVSYYGAQSAMRDRIDQSVKELRSELKEVRTEFRETFVSKDSIQELKSRMDQTAEAQRQLAASVAQLDKTITSFLAVQQAKRSP